MKIDATQPVVRDCVARGVGVFTSLGDMVAATVELNTHDQYLTEPAALANAGLAIYQFSTAMASPDPVVAKDLKVVAATHITSALGYGLMASGHVGTGVTISLLSAAVRGMWSIPDACV